jgi:hypothetical protein
MKFTRLRSDHNYASAVWRKPYARRTAGERTFSAIKDPASNDIFRGWCRLKGRAPMFVWVTCCLAVRNLRVLDAFDARQAEDARRSAAGLSPKSRRRQTIRDLNMEYIEMLRRPGAPGRTRTYAHGLGNRCSIP